MSGAWPVEVDYDQLLHLLQCGVNKTNIAKQLDISRPTLYKIISDYQLEDIASW
jgi:transcriptional regulator of acetoin/glycerol metabolism